MTTSNLPRETSSPKQQPTHIAKSLRQNGELNTFDRIGAAWLREDGSIFVKLAGTQIVADGFSLYPNDTPR